MIRLYGLLLCMAAVGLAGCGGEKPFRKSTSVVTGKVTVDGVAPTSDIQIARQWQVCIGPALGCR